MKALSGVLTSIQNPKGKQNGTAPLQTFISDSKVINNNYNNQTFDKEIEYQQLKIAVPLVYIYQFHHPLMTKKDG